MGKYFLNKQSQKLSQSDGSQNPEQGRIFKAQVETNPKEKKF